LPAHSPCGALGAECERLESVLAWDKAVTEGLGAMTADLFHENWRHEQRADGLYVIIEEIGGLGALGPFPDADAARIGFARYFLGLDHTPPSAPVLPKADDRSVTDRRPGGASMSDLDVKRLCAPGDRSR